jgi:hypothetical protein
MAGALGCVGLLMLPFVIAIILGMTTVNNLVNTLVGIFNPPPPTYRLDTSALVLEKLKPISQLTTTRYNYSSIVTGERELPPILATLYGDRLVMIAVGHIEAGIDLLALTPEDIALADGVLTINLPPPALLTCFLNEAESYVVSRDSGIFAAPAPNMDTETRRYALRQFRDMAVEGGILTEAQIHSQTAIQQFVGALGIANVRSVQVNSSTPDPNAVLPESCR